MMRVVTPRRRAIAARFRRLPGLGSAVREHYFHCCLDHHAAHLRHHAETLAVSPIACDRIRLGAHQRRVAGKPARVKGRLDQASLAPVFVMRAVDQADTCYRTRAQRMVRPCRTSCHPRISDLSAPDSRSPLFSRRQVRSRQDRRTPVVKPGNGLFSTNLGVGSPGDTPQVVK
jgi:hypothetical protein